MMLLNDINGLRYIYIDIKGVELATISLAEENNNNKDKQVNNIMK